MKKIFLILGMHRSATSLTAGILYSYGMYAGEEEDLLEADNDNQHGFFENKKVFWLNEMIWCEHGSYSGQCSDKINLISNTKYTNEIRDIIKDLIQNSKENQDIFIKDPRICMVEPVWRKEIKKCGIEENIIVVFRHPYEVAKSLQKRNNINFIYGLKLWFYYNLSILYCIAGSDIPVLILKHEDYFNKKTIQMNKLEKFIDYDDINKEAVNFIDISLRHNYMENIKGTDNSELENMVYNLYKYLIYISDNNCNVSKIDLKQYDMYLKKIVATSYDVEEKDMSYMYYKDVNGIEKKMWCLYQLYDKKNILASKFKNYFNEYNVKDIYIYGNGTITEGLVPVLNRAGISIKKIIDKSKNGYIEDLQNAEAQTYILNTVVNYGNSVLKDLLKYFKAEFILDIYILLKEII